MRLRGTKMNIQDHYGHTNAENDMSLVQCMYVGMSLVNSIYCTSVCICIHYLVCIRNVKRSMYVVAAYIALPLAIICMYVQRSTFSHIM